MSDPELYARTLLNAASGNPDFYICMGDDFSVDTLRTVNAETVAERYTLQRPFLGLVAQSAPLFLVNGNHEQASLFNFNQSDVRHDVAVWAQNARNRYFPTPAPDGFYTGDTEPLKSIGPLKDYYAWTWGDALFVVLDYYWHSPALVDNGFHEDRAAARGPRPDTGIATGGGSPSVTRNTNGSSGRSNRARPGTSSSSPIMFSARAGAALRSPTCMNGAAGTDGAIGSSTRSGPAGGCPFTS